MTMYKKDTYKFDEREPQVEGTNIYTYIHMYIHMYIHTTCAYCLYIYKCMSSLLK